MSNHYVFYRLASSTRMDIRKEIGNLFISEVCGTGNKNNTSHYTYYVESYGQYGIELHRPAVLNFGFDFTVHISGLSFFKTTTYLRKGKPVTRTTNYTNPSHDDIKDALTQCKNFNPVHYAQIVIPMLQDIFNCVPVILSTIQPLGCFTDHTGASRPIEIIIYALKWLFIEQDITYWNYSGRQMLYNELVLANLI